MAKSRKKKQAQREAKRHGEVGTLWGVPAVDNHQPVIGLRRAVLEAIVFSAKHLGAFNEQMAEKVLNGQTKALYISVPDLTYQLEHIVKDSHPEPRRTPADGAAVTMANDRSEEVPAIPEPLSGLKKYCSCGRSFWKLQNYRAHYAHDHIVMGTQPL